MAESEGRSRYPVGSSMNGKDSKLEMTLEDGLGCPTGGKYVTSIREAVLDAVDASERLTVGDVVGTTKPIIEVTAVPEEVEGVGRKVTSEVVLFNQIPAGENDGRSGLVRMSPCDAVDRKIENDELAGSVGIGWTETGEVLFPSTD